MTGGWVGRKEKSMSYRKYHNKKPIVNGIRFDSKAEACRYAELNALERAGQIYNLKCQECFELIPNQKDPNGKCVRKVEYVADFVYTDSNGVTIVEDVKGMRTRDYIIKKKLMLKVHGIWIQEIKA